MRMQPRLLLLLLTSLSFLGLASSRARAAEPFTFPDMVELLQQKLPTPRILDLLSTKCLTFLVDSAAVKDLRLAGADDTLILGLRTVCNPRQELVDTYAELRRLKAEVDSMRFELQFLADSAVARRRKIEQDSTDAQAVRTRQADEIAADLAARAALEQKEGSRDAARMYADRAAKYSAAGNFELAEREYRAAVRATSPENPAGGSEKEFKTYAIALGTLLFEQGKFNPTIEVFAKSLTVGDSWEAYYYIGCSWMELNSPERAIRALQKAKELTSSDVVRKAAAAKLEILNGKR